MLSSKLKASLKIAVLSGVGIALGITAMYLNKKGTSDRPSRSMASAEAAYKAHGLRLGKQAAAVTVQIFGPETFPQNADETVELVGYITQHDSEEAWIAYQWILPADVELVQGPLKDNLANVPMGKTEEVRLLVKGFSTQRQKLITLKADITKGSTQLGASDIIVSRPGDTPEAKTMKLQAQARNAASEQEYNEKEREAGNK